MNFKELFFDTLKIENGVFQNIDQHLIRSINTAKFLNLDTKIIEQIIRYYEELSRPLDELSRCKVSFGFVLDRFTINKEVSTFIDDLAPLQIRRGETIKVVSSDKNLHWKLSSNIHRNFDPRKEGYDLFYSNENDCLCETTIANIYLEVEEGYFWTPPLSDGVMAGTIREKLLRTPPIIENKKIEIVEHSIKSEFLFADSNMELYISNSLIGFQKARLIS